MRPIQSNTAENYSRTGDPLIDGPMDLQRALTDRRPVDLSRVLEVGSPLDLTATQSGGVLEPQIDLQEPISLAIEETAEIFRPRLVASVGEPERDVEHLLRHARAIPKRQAMHAIDGRKPDVPLESIENTPKNIFPDTASFYEAQLKAQTGDVDGRLSADLIH